METVKKFAEFINDENEINKINESFDPKNLSVRKIIKDPTQTIIDEDMVEDTIEAVISDMEHRDIKDDESISKILIYFGINFSNFVDIIENKFINYLLDNDIITSKTIKKYKNTLNVLYAAWPDKNDFENLDEIKLDINDLKKLMKEYFPWRLGDNDEINYIHNKILDLED